MFFLRLRSDFDSDYKAQAKLCDCNRKAIIIKVKFSCSAALISFFVSFLKISFLTTLTEIVPCISFLKFFESLIQMSLTPIVVVVCSSPVVVNNCNNIINNRKQQHNTEDTTVCQSLRLEFQR